MSNRNTLPSLTSHPVEPAASAPGTIIRYALAIEAGVNLFGVAGMLLYPDVLVRWLSADPTPDTTSGTAAVASGLIHLLAALLAGFTTPLLLCIPNSKRALESRPTVYATLLAGEVALVLVMLRQALVQENGVGIRPGRLLFMVGTLGPLGRWRVGVLGIRPEGVGAYGGGRKKGE